MSLDFPAHESRLMSTVLRPREGAALEACYLATKCIVPVVTRDNTGFVMISPNHRTAAAADE